MPEQEKIPSTKYGDESLEDVLQEMTWGLDFQYDGAPYSSKELWDFIRRIRAVVDLTMVRKN